MHNIKQAAMHLRKSSVMSFTSLLSKCTYCYVFGFVAAAAVKNAPRLGKIRKLKWIQNAWYHLLRIIEFNSTKSHSKRQNTEL